MALIDRELHLYPVHIGETMIVNEEGLMRFLSISEKTLENQIKRYNGLENYLRWLQHSCVKLDGVTYYTVEQYTKAMNSTDRQDFRDLWLKFTKGGKKEVLIKLHEEEKAIRLKTQQWFVTDNQPYSYTEFSRIIGIFQTELKNIIMGSTTREECVIKINDRIQKIREVDREARRKERDAEESEKQ